MPYDAIVLGLGGVGSAALYHFAQRGLRVLGIEQFGRAHDRGSSHGQTRIIRQAYFEHPAYVPLVLRSYELWHALEQHTGQKLLHEVGLLQIGPAGGEVISGVLASAHEHGLSVESLTAREAMARFRGFVVDEGNVAVFERRAGYLRVEACVAAHLDEAARLGAEIHYDEPARQWHAGDSDVTVTTDRGTYPAGSLIVTAGPWAGAMLAAVGLRLEVLRKPQLWYRPTADDYRAEGGCPAFLFETSEGIFYGFPQLGPEGVKVAEHTGGAVVADPSAVDRALHAADRQRIEEFCGHALPGLSRECMRWAICMYTMSADRHFIVDLCHEQPRVALVAGLSGHGFKFTPVLGEAIADMVTLGTCGLPSELFGLDRVL